jgi:hypothetical protein
MNALHDLTLRDLHDARRMLHYPDHADTVADALAHWHDHVWADYLKARKADPGAFDKDTALGGMRRRRWASQLWDARRALRDLR